MNNQGQQTKGETPTQATHNLASEGARDFVSHVHEYVIDHIKLADEKAAFVVTIASAMLAFLHTQKLLPSLAFEFSLIGFLRLLSITGLGLAIGFAAWVVLPRTTGDSKGIVFWKSIAAAKSSQLYEDSLRAASPEELMGALARHIHELSRVCRTKYQKLSWAMYVGVAGLLASVGLLLLKK